jgi:L-asparaginase
VRAAASVNANRAVRPRVRVIAAGGTIACQGDALVAPTFSGGALLAGVRSLEEHAELEVEDFSDLLSSELTVEQVHALALRLARALQEDVELAGLVVTHGTGTLEESAFMADLLVDDPRPIVFTGAMRAGEDGDGPANLVDAVRVAASKSAAGKGVLVTMNGAIHAARYAYKGHTTALDAFRSTGNGPLGRVYPDRIDLTAAPLQRLHFANQAQPPVADVDLIKFVVGMTDRHIRASVEAGVAGVVIEGSGLGNVNSRVVPAIIEAIERGIVVVLASRTGDGRVWPYYATAGGSGTLVKHGCLVSSLSGPKTRILLTIALTNTRDPQQLQAFLDPGGMN